MNKPTIKATFETKNGKVLLLHETKQTMFVIESLKKRLPKTRNSTNRKI